VVDVVDFLNEYNVVLYCQAWVCPAAIKLAERLMPEREVTTNDLFASITASTK